MGKRLSIGIAICALLLGSVATAAAQGFAGGLRGVVKDANGVVPGAEVDTDQRRNSGGTDRRHQRRRRLRVRERSASHLHHQGRADRLQDARAGRHPHRHAADSDPRPHARGRPAAGDDHGHGCRLPSSTRRTPRWHRRSTRRRSRPCRRLAATRSSWRSPSPNVIPSGDPQFVRQQDQTNSALLSLAGGPRRGNNYTLEGVSITDLRNRAVDHPDIEAVEEVKVQVSTFDAEMGRTGGGVFNTIGKSGTNNWHGSGLYQNRPSGTLGKFYFADKARPATKPDSYFYLCGRLLRRPHRPQHDLLLGEHARATRRSPAATPCSRCRPSASATATSRRAASPSTTR